MDTIYSKAISIDYWNRNAKWYDLWLKHNNYHERILKILKCIVKPGWKILDIGAGSGVLSIPLSETGCNITAIEPSFEMRKIFYDEISKRQNINIFIDKRKWEDFNVSNVKHYELIIASNSLHLMEIGFERALLKVFSLRPDYVFLVTENLSLNFDNFRKKYLFQNVLNISFTVESSYAYHNTEEVFEHWYFKNGKVADANEKIKILSEIDYIDGHFWKKGFAQVNINLLKMNSINSFKNDENYIFRD